MTPFNIYILSVEWCHIARCSYTISLICHSFTHGAEDHVRMKPHLSVKMFYRWDAVSEVFLMLQSSLFPSHNVTSVCVVSVKENSSSAAMDFLCGSGSMEGQRWFDLVVTLKAVDATKPSGLIPGEGAIRENPLGAIWETSPSHTHTHTQTHTHTLTHKHKIRD